MMVSRLRLTFHYLYYWITAQTKHDVHSPFVFEFITQVLENRSFFPEYLTIESFRKEFRKDNRTITITDFGAGSQIKKTPERTVKEIIASAAKPPKYGQLLFRMVRHYRPAFILELGTSLGISTLYLAMPDTTASVITVEGDPAIAALAQENFSKITSNIHPLIGNFDDVLPDILNKSLQQPVLFFLDGNHRKTPTLNYFEQCLANVNDQAIFIFDDIHWSPEMQEAWEDIKRHPRVKVTIDVFFMGIVFLHNHLQKQDYVIRF